MTPYTDGFQVISPRAGFLAGRGANFSSQFGEDGLIAAWHERFPPTNRWCFEVGAADGKRLSNTLRLRNDGWRAVLIEGDAEAYEELRKLKSDTVTTVPKKIQPNSLDKILSDCGAPADMDMGVIDIDGMDYWAWEGLIKHRPRLMLVEFRFLSEEDVDFVPDTESDKQASYKAIIRLGLVKGYEPLAKTPCNILFADI